MPWNWWQTTGKYIRKFDDKILFFKTITANWNVFPRTQGSVSHIFWLSWQKYRALGDQSDGDYKRFNRHKIGERRERGRGACFSSSQYLHSYSRHVRRPRCVAMSGLSLVSSWRGWWPLTPWCDLSPPRPRGPRGWSPCHRRAPWPRPGPCRSQSPRCCPCPPRPGNVTTE